MYNNLLYAVKKRIMDETEDAFKGYPVFSKKVVVRNKFPYEERIQYGVVVRNAAASQIRLSPDNFMSDLFSHVRLITDPEETGTSIEWVRENQGWVTEEVTEDVSSQLDGTVRVLLTDYQILQGTGNTEYSTSPGQVEVKINDEPTVPELVDGENGEVRLYRAPSSTDIVTITYTKRNIVPAGLFTIDFFEDWKFRVTAVYVISNEEVIERTTGLESTAELLHDDIEVNSEELYVGYTADQGRINKLTKDDDYTIDYPTGVITFLAPLQKNYALYADYRYVPLNYPPGPHTYAEYTENTTAIPGVVLSIGRRYNTGDKQIVVVSKFTEQQAQIYGGHWEMSVDLAVIAKDPMQMEQMSDRLVEYLWGVRKNILENEGLTLNSVEPSGESEEVHIDTTGDLYFESSVSINIMTEWQLFKPYTPLYKIRDITVTPSLTPIFKGPIVGYERLT